MSARTSVGRGGAVCQVLSCGGEASKLPVEVTLASGLVLELAACPNHSERLFQEFDSLLVGDEERVA
ncbi:MAG: hypothetical protein JF922_12260 [Candidatus Dormibacteraeota bacterium]|uniref:Uncharacterized protein n=2 Tax=Candidatus Nephthysia bennettiae TaxID=3127016 RepID=A0A934K2Q6_9BACT|nr:hypothetical protein [Candidatus Dormibacteraeota bacterium]MBJ7613487.1 hypothetical protein [Candidatus Dormibacteraeota bacterium]